jgi:hypothetical protein
MVHFLKAKNEVLLKFISFKAFVEKQTSYYIKALCSNCGGKYLSQDF